MTAWAISSRFSGSGGVAAAVVALTHFYSVPPVPVIVRREGDPRLIDFLIPSPIAVTFDFAQTPDGMLDESYALATAVSLALATDARANPDDELLSPGDFDRRGWWADTDAQTIWGAWPIGSKLWLYQRSAIVDQNAQRGALVTQIQNAIQEAIQPFLDQKLASRIEVEVARTGLEQISARVTLYRGPQPDIALQFQSLWNVYGGQ